ncbi:MAG: ABC transporter ATP-binding protein [Anaerolineaceae bacterium]|nr:ABC transporter ATP-binding protein [Anaerolineaceae bacterium]HNZ15761.1 ABC transporter ATP-binding protein [Anaerolineaceae bacterium]
MEAIIDIQNLSYAYPDGKLALDGINLRLFPGEKVALVGANGAGKTTLLYHVNGIFTGTGSIRVDNLDMNKTNLGKIRALVGVVFQNPDDQLFSSTVYEDVAFGPIYQGLDKASVRERVTQALQSVSMEDYSSRTPYHLSTGEKKKIAIATVLSMQPKILVLDEPTAGLDPRARRELIELLQQRPQTMLIATHNMDLARRLTSRTVLMNEGKIAAEGPTHAILENEALLSANGLV